MIINLTRAKLCASARRKFFHRTVEWRQLVSYQEKHSFGKHSLFSSFSLDQFDVGVSTFKLLREASRNGIKVAQ